MHRNTPAQQQRKGHIGLYPSRGSQRRAAAAGRRTVEARLLSRDALGWRNVAGERRCFLRFTGGPFRITHSRSGLVRARLAEWGLGKALVHYRGTRLLLMLTAALLLVMLSLLLCFVAADVSLAMWKGIKKALGHRAKAQKTSTGQDSSTRSTCSAGQSSHGGALFPLDMTELDAMLTADATSKQQHQSNQQQPAPAAALTWAQLQQQLQQQHDVQALLQQTEDSTSKRRAAAMQKRVNNSMLNPSTCMYQIKALLSLSTLFEHKVSAPAVAAGGAQSCACSCW